MSMSPINTFMSHDTINEDTESSERERGARNVVAWSQLDGSGNHIGARARPLVATSVPLSGERTYDCARATDWRTVSTSDIQDSPRRACTIACLLSPQWFVTKRNCHPRSQEVFDVDASTPPTWLSDLQSLLQFVWNCFRSSAPHQVTSKCMDYWLRIALAQ
jgi:hypothetical protein